MAALRASSEALRKRLDALTSHRRLDPLKDDLFMEIDPAESQEWAQQSPTDDEPPIKVTTERDREKAGHECTQHAPAGGVTRGCHHHLCWRRNLYDKSRPMGLADLMGLQLSDDTPPEAPAHPSPLVAPSQARATLVGVDKYKPESRPMGLFGLLSAEGAVSAVVVGRRLQLMRRCR